MTLPKSLRRFVSASTLLGLTAGLGPMLAAQPQHAPPPRVSADAACQEMGGPTLVTVHAKDASPLEVMTQVTKQAGVGLLDAHDALRDMKPMSVSYEKQPFWLVVRELTRRLNLSFELLDARDVGSNAADWVLYLRKGRDPRLQGPGLVRGPLFIIASRVSRCLSLAEAGEPAFGQHTEVDFIVLADPKLRTRGVPDAGVAAYASQERTLKGKTVVHPADSNARQMWHIKAMFHTPAKDDRTLAKMSGTFRVIVATKSELWEVNDVLEAKNLVKTAGRARFAVRGISKMEAGKRTQYSVTLASWGEGETADIGWPARSDHERMRSVRLLDASGLAFFPRSCSSEDGAFTVKFGSEHSRGTHAEGAPVRLQWELPTRVVEIHVPFEFANLPAPD